MNELITTSEGIAVLNPDIAEKIAEFERRAKEIKDAEDKLKEAILTEMESKGIIKLETESLNITYVAPTTRESLDGKTLKEELPDIYDTYVKLSTVKSSIRLKVK